MMARFAVVASCFLLLALCAVQGITQSTGNGGGPGIQAETTPRVQAQPSVSAQDVTVYITRTGSKYHRAGCRSLAKSSIPISLKDAATKGYGPCSICKPPKTNSPVQSASATMSSAAPSRETVAPPGSQDVTVYVTRTGAKYHRAGCRYLARSMIPMPLKEAAARYGPCSVCKPPVPK